MVLSSGAGDRPAVDAGFSGAGFNKPGDAVEQDGLAALARAENDQKLVFVDLKGYPVQHMQQSVLPRDMDFLCDVFFLIIDYVGQ